MCSEEKTDIKSSGATTATGRWHACSADSKYKARGCALEFTVHFSAIALLLLPVHVASPCSRGFEVPVPRYCTSYHGTSYDINLRQGKWSLFVLRTPGIRHDVLRSIRRHYDARDTTPWIRDSTLSPGVLVNNDVHLQLVSTSSCAQARVYIYGH